jgi:uncharacterized damage-inducible protein DinB
MTKAGHIHRILARNAMLANARLSRACLNLRPGEWEAPRVSFFPSLKLTMLHVLDADRYYRETIMPGALLAAALTVRESVATYSEERKAVDLWYLRFCNSLTGRELQRHVTVHWPERTFTEPWRTCWFTSSCTANHRKTSDAELAELES